MTRLRWMHIVAIRGRRKVGSIDERIPAICRPTHHHRCGSDLPFGWSARSCQGSFILLVFSSLVAPSRTLSTRDCSPAEHVHKYEAVIPDTRSSKLSEILDRTSSVDILGNAANPHCSLNVNFRHFIRLISTLYGTVSSSSLSKMKIQYLGTKIRVAVSKLNSLSPRTELKQTETSLQHAYRLIGQLSLKLTGNPVYRLSPTSVLGSRR